MYISDSSKQKHLQGVPVLSLLLGLIGLSFLLACAPEQNSSVHNRDQGSSTDPQGPKDPNGPKQGPKVSDLRKPWVSNSVRIGLTHAGEHCSGFLATAHLVITAGHCFDPNRGRPVNPTRIFFGDRTERRVTEFARYVGHAEEDIAWIKFEGDLPSGYQPIPILADPHHAIPAGGDIQFKGYTSVGGPGLYLDLVTPVNLNQIQDQYHRALTGMGIAATLDQVRQNYFFTEGTRLAPGDSGGPAYYLYNGVWTCAAILMGTYDPTVPPTNPGGTLEKYTTVAPYIPWIEGSSGEALSHRR